MLSKKSAAQLNAKIRESKQKNPFELPDGVTSHSKDLPNGTKSFIFEHPVLGELGRILVQPTPSGQSFLTAEVFGTEGDPLLEKRKSLFTPIAEDINQRYADIFSETSENKQETQPPIPPLDEDMVYSKYFECDQCGGYCAHLVDAPHADSSEKMLKLAVKILPEAKKMGVPTWILGSPMSFAKPVEIVGNRMLCIYPGEKQEEKALTPQEFGEILNSYQLDCSSHCTLEEVQKKVIRDSEEIAGVLHEFIEYHRSLKTPASVIIDQIPPYMSKFENLMDICPKALFKDLVQKYPYLALYEGMHKGPK